MELADYLQILNRRKWIIILTAVVTLAAYYFIRPIIPTTSESTAILRISPYTSSNPSYNALLYADRIMNNYVKIASSTPLLNQLRGTLALTSDQPFDLKVEILPDSELLLITVEDYDPVLARDVANTLAELLSTIKVTRDIKITIVDPATLPEPPTVLREVMLAAFAVILGLMGGVGLAFIIENLDTRLFTIKRIEMVTGLPVFGEIPVSPVGLLKNSPLLNDSLRRLRTKLLVESRTDPFQTLMISSAEPKEGKSTIIAHLGRSMALTGRRCIIVDADLYCPTTHKLFDLPNDVGLSSVLENKEALSDSLCETQFPDLFVLTSGPPIPNSAELLGSVQTSTLLEELKNEFDMIFLDSPAFLGAVDTAVLASAVDVVILVARCGSIRVAPLLATCKQLEDVHAKPLGMVVNRVKKPLPRRYHKYYQRSKLVRAKAMASVQSGDIARSSQSQKEEKDSRIIDRIKELRPSDGERDEISQETMPVKDKLADIKDIGPTSEKALNVTRIIDRINALLPSDGEREEIPKEKILLRDELTEINGIGPAYEKALNAIGITTFAQLAEQAPDDLANRIEGRKSPSHTQCLQWIHQAEALSKTPDDHQMSGNDENTNDDTF
jgi:capsular exopolysaccharide synthesis family protein